MNKNIGERIRKLRMSKKMTLAVMAERLGVTISSVGAYENGTRTPSYDVLIRISKLFNVTVDNLINNTDMDYINVAGLTSKQRDIIIEQINSYQKLNKLIYSVMSIDNRELSESNLELCMEDDQSFRKLIDRIKAIQKI